MAEKRAEAPLILAVASGRTLRDAARAAGVAERTAYRRAAEPGFKRAVQQARADLLARAVGQLADATTAAVATLVALLDAEADTVRLSAARAILDSAMRGAELVDLAARVESVEVMLALDKPPERSTWRA